MSDHGTLTLETGTSDLREPRHGGYCSGYCRCPLDYDVDTDRFSRATTTSESESTS